MKYILKNYFKYKNMFKGCNTKNLIFNIDISNVKNRFYLFFITKIKK